MICKGSSQISKIYKGTTEITKVFKGSTKVYEKSADIITPLNFTAQEANSTVKLNTVGSPSIANTAYSLDNNTWNSYTTGTTIILANMGDKVYFRNDIIADFSYSSYLQFTMTGKIAGSGNCNSMYSATDFENVTTLSYSYCYSHMFDNCTSLTTPPALPATTLAYECYYYMFYNCTSLTTAPVLPATILAYGCYWDMFYNCASLTTPPALPATTLANKCYYCMFDNCTSLTTAPVLPATILAYGCYLYMFDNCTSLTTAPALPATTLASSCYEFMFNRCTSLQVSDTQTSEASYAWTIPTSGTFTAASTQKSIFTKCLGTRSSNNLTATAGESVTYYTQNEPI